jgi:hypothetical protein
MTAGAGRSVLSGARFLCLAGGLLSAGLQPHAHDGGLGATTDAIRTALEDAIANGGRADPDDPTRIIITIPDQPA